MLLAIFAVSVACNKKEQAAPEPKAVVTPPATKAAPLGDVAAPSDVAAPPVDATRSASGLAWKVLTPGTGAEHAEDQDRAQVHYTTWTTDGKLVMNTRRRARPASVAVAQEIPGVAEALKLMVAGEKRRLWIPEPLAYGNTPGRPKGMLVYELELLSIVKGPKPIPAPADVAAPPAQAEKSPSGLAWLVLSAGRDKVRPAPEATVEVHYTGWTTDGKMFDSSVARGVPARFGLKQVIPGWTEGVGLMTVGEKRRFWIPKDLAYNDRDGKPKGMLVFEVELISFVAPPAAPADLKAPAKGATKTASGLAWKLLAQGKGTEHPADDSIVELNMSGWSSEGKLVETTTMTGRTARRALKATLPGLAEGIRLMAPGEQRRFWIPEELAFKGAPGRPKGMVVYDVELVSIGPAPRLAPPTGMPGMPGMPGTPGAPAGKGAMPGMTIVPPQGAKTPVAPQ